MYESQQTKIRTLCRQNDKSESRITAQMSKALNIQRASLCQTYNQNALADLGNEPYHRAQYRSVFLSCQVLVSDAVLSSSNFGLEANSLAGN